MKKFYAVLLVLLTTCLCQLRAASKSGFFRVDNITYQVVDLDNATVSVYKVDPSVTGTLTLPSSVKDPSGKEFSVTGMEKDCILNTPITKIVLPATLADNNGTSGFQYGSLACPTLQEIALGGGDVFKVVDGVLLNANGHRLEAYPANKPGSAYTIPSTVLAVMPFAFAEARNLETLTIPKGFGQWNNEENVANMGCWANISSLKNYKVEDGNTYYSVRDGVLYKKDAYGKSAYLLVSYPAKKTGKTYTADADIITVEPYAFSEVSDLEEINFSSIEYWKQPVIMNCMNVKKVTAKDSRYLKYKENAIFNEAYLLYYTPSVSGGTYTVPEYVK